MLTRNAHPFRKPPVVFRRWSRSGYAQFVSMKREVVIAPLKASICYASMLKQGILMNDDHSPEFYRRNGADEDDDGSGGSPQHAAEFISVSTAVTMPVAPCVLCASDDRGGRCMTSLKACNFNNKIQRNPHGC